MRRHILKTSAAQSLPPQLPDGETTRMTERISDESTEYYKDRSTWVRGLFMLLFIALYHVAAVVVGVKVGVTVVAVTKAAVTDRAFVLAHHPVDDQPKPCHAGLFRFWPWLILMRQSFRLEKKIQRRRNQCAPSLNRCGR